MSHFKIRFPSQKVRPMDLSFSAIDIMNSTKFNCPETDNNPQKTDRFYNPTASDS